MLTTLNTEKALCALSSNWAALAVSLCGKARWSEGEERKEGEACF